MADYRYSAFGPDVVTRSIHTGDIKERVATCSTRTNAQRMAARMQRALEDSFLWRVEVTDTYGGEANYAWVRRYAFRAPKKASDREIMRRAKALAGYTGVKGRSDDFGDALEFRPRGDCVVMFVNLENEA
jgi:hypothetical protein